MLDNPVEVAFGDINILYDLIMCHSSSGIRVILCHRHIAERLGIREELEMEARQGTIWIDSCPRYPTQREIVNALMQVGDSEPSEIIAIGGGSTIDVGKAISLIYGIFKTRSISIPEVTQLLISGDYAIPHQVIDVIAVPTTAGTGSEVTPFATIWDVDGKNKYSIDTPLCYAKKAYCIPKLTLSLPPRVTLSTGLDALSHSIEAFWAKRTTVPVKKMSLSAIDLIMTYLPLTLENPQNIEFRKIMMQGALLAGLSFSKTRTTACHSIGYPITLQYGVEHGFASALTLDAVSKINRESILMEEDLFSMFKKHGGLQRWIDRTCGDIVRLRLRSFGIPKGEIGIIAMNSFTKGRMDNNPVELSLEQVERILLSVY